MSIDLETADRTTKIVSAYLSNNATPRNEVPGFIREVYEALSGLGAAAEPAPELRPAVPIAKSITPDYLVCLDDGMKLKSLRRHLRQLGMTPEEYRAKWDLPPDYPMVAPNYSAVRSRLAKEHGLGTKGVSH